MNLVIQCNVIHVEGVSLDSSYLLPVVDPINNVASKNVSSMVGRPGSCSSGTDFQCPSVFLQIPFRGHSCATELSGFLTFFI